MVYVPLRALEQEDEPVLEEALVELNDVAESEPKFFRKHYKDIFGAFMKILEKNDYTNSTLRHQPVEFLTTVGERIPTILEKDDELLKNLLDVIFKIMIDIDEEIDVTWLRPKEGFRIDEDEEDEDDVSFGKSCIDRLVASLGDEKMLPLLSILVQNTLANDQDWRFKHAGLMALSQVGEYIEDAEKIAPMVPTIIAHLTH